MKTFAFIPAVLLCLSINLYAAAYGGGSGTTVDPYLIYTAEQMNTIGANPGDWGKCFKLVADIDMSAYTGTQYNIIGNSTTKFTGTFDGNGHVICNLTYTTTGQLNYVGLFGYTSGATIQNLGVENISISSGGSHIGGLVGSNSGGTITSCYATGSVSGIGYAVGGLVGYNSNSGLLTTCYATGSVTGTNAYIGGLVGLNGGTLTTCYATGSVTGLVTGTDYFDYVGGLVGANSGTITSCYATGAVTGTEDDIGGLVGYNDGTIASCYATGAVSGRFHSEYVGGLVGDNDCGSITSCYATGLISGYYYYDDTVGGLVGRNAGPIIRCFWDVQTSGVSSGVGLGSSTGVTGKTTEEMKTLSTFTDAGWDFANESVNGLHDFWQMSDNKYPSFAVHVWTLEGEGTDVTPYIVSMPAELGKIWLRPAAYYRLVSDLDLAGISWSTVIIPEFYGVFEGQGFKISNLIINQPGGHNIGFFGRINTDCQVRNLGVENVNITGNHYVGGLVGRNSGTITSCYATGLVTNIASDNFYGVGGLVGINSGTITSCYATGSASGYGNVGGLVGGNSGTITSCYATDSVSGNYNYFGSVVGGLVGSNSFTITSCYSTGLVTNTGSGSSYVEGGLVGRNSGTITACFWDTDTSETTDGVGNKSPDPAGVSGKTTAEMKTLSTFTSASWDFTNETTNGTNDYWRMCTNEVNYPKLNWESIDGDFACPDSVNIEDLDYFVGRWLANNCTSSNNYCSGTDMNASGGIDLADLAIFAQHWLEGI